MVVATIQPATVGVAVVVAAARLVADKMYLPLAWAYHTSRHKNTTLLVQCDFQLSEESNFVTALVLHCYACD